MKNEFYTLRPLHRVFGAEVQGVDLQTVAFTPAFTAQIREDLMQHRVLLFRKQTLSGKRQVRKMLEAKWRNRTLINCFDNCVPS